MEERRKGQGQVESRAGLLPYALSPGRIPLPPYPDGWAIHDRNRRRKSVCTDRKF
jgi:hypothetical protein